MNRWYWRGIVGVAALGVIAVIVMFLLPKPPIPSQVKSQLTSTLVLPKNRQYAVDRDTVKYDSSLKVLSFNLSAFEKTIVLSEQPTPQQFVDVPEVYQKVLDGMADYADFDTSVGTVHLTTPPQLHGGQTAVLNTKGTLLFAKPSDKLSEDQWRKFFTSFVVAQ